MNTSTSVLNENLRYTRPAHLFGHISGTIKIQTSLNHQNLQLNEIFQKVVIYNPEKPIIKPQIQENAIFRLTFTTFESKYRHFQLFSDEKSF